MRLILVLCLYDKYEATIDDKCSLAKTLETGKLLVLIFPIVKLKSTHQHP